MDRQHGGGLTATAAQRPIQMGRDGVELVDKLRNGEAVEQLGETSYEIVSAENAASVLESMRADLEAAGMRVDP